MEDKIFTKNNIDYITYCKICGKQFKRPKRLSLHRNSQFHKINNHELSLYTQYKPYFAEYMAKYFKQEPNRVKNLERTKQYQKKIRKLQKAS